MLESRGSDPAALFISGLAESRALPALFFPESLLDLVVPPISVHSKHCHRNPTNLYSRDISVHDESMRLRRPRTASDAE